MEHTVRVVTRQPCFSLIRTFQPAFLWFSQHDCRLDMKISSAGETIVLDMGMSRVQPLSYLDFSGLREVFNYQLAELLARHIREEWSRRLIRQTVDRCAPPGDFGARDYIAWAASRYMSCDQPEGPIQDMLDYSRKQKIAAVVRGYLSDNDEFNVEGFINFRLRGYKKQLEQITLYVIDKFQQQDARDLLSGLMKVLYITRYLS
jgi:hypothetical protein